MLALTMTPAAAQAQTQATAPIQTQAGAQAGWRTDATAGASEVALHASRQDVAYLRAAHRGHLAEIAAGKAALSKSRDRDVRGIAWRLIRDHRKLDARLRGVADRLDVRLPGSPSAEQRRDLRAVLSRSGHRFDRAWLRLQVDAHEHALWLGQRELRRGHSNWVKDLARDSAPVIRHHLRAVRAEM
uniref:Putative exported protein n=1 Tax=Nonomuraea gerenzanensis TaxID=93944 RepID=A0A1M4E8T2_9ACTN|nr:putative exported protein [Nonomuraea gerenzanensis]